EAAFPEGDGEETITDASADEAEGGRAPPDREVVVEEHAAEGAMGELRRASGVQSECKSQFSRT
ncbi:hypothetical protein, partial [Henriciella sp.]|uniref:hypothetical protein n=1 Tax=Henriciella sp. TaxID=1968823 RepID=UPI0025BB4361